MTKIQIHIMGKIYTFFLLFIATFAFSQQAENISIDDRLYQVFDRNYLENLKTTNPFLIQRWNYYLDNAWSIKDLPEEKQSSVNQTVTIPNLETINILLLEKQFDLKPDWQKFNFYKIEGTNKMLVYLPGKDFVNRLNEHLGRTYNE